MAEISAGCACGAVFIVSAPTIADALARHRQWLVEHSGRGHGPVSERDARRVSKRKPKVGARA